MESSGVLGAFIFSSKFNVFSSYVNSYDGSFLLLCRQLVRKGKLGTRKA
jgi:hypothetical protein